MTSPGPAAWPDWPFCSPRCKLIDLGRWLKGDYRLPSATPADEASDEDEPPEKSAVPSAVPDRDEA